MRIKLILWVIVIVTVGTIMLQNLDFYLAESNLSLNFYVTRVHLPPLPNATQILFFFLAGILLASLSYVAEGSKARKEIKSLNNAYHSCVERVTALKRIDNDEPRKPLLRLPLGIRRKANAAAKSSGGTKGAIESN